MRVSLYKPTNNSVHIKFREDFKNRLKDEARKAGVGISVYVKYVLLEKWAREQQLGIEQEKLNRNKRISIWENWRKDQQKMTDNDVLLNMELDTLYPEDPVHKANN